MAVKRRTTTKELQQQQGDAEVKPISAVVQDFLPQIKAALPQHMRPERIARLALTEMRTNPKLAEAVRSNPRAFLGAIIQCSQMGLEPGIEAYIIPYWSKKRQEYDIQVIPDYRGLIQLVRRTGKINLFYSQVVHEGDTFKFQYGSRGYLHHVPRDQSDQITHFYAFARFAGGVEGEEQFEVMSIDEMSQIAAASESEVWAKHFIPMGRKTVAKRLANWLPKSPELAQAIQLDNQFEAGITQNNAQIIDISDDSSSPQQHIEPAAKLTGDRGTGGSPKTPISPEAQEDAEIKEFRGELGGVNGED